jgi:hypothetical protein
MLRLGKQSSSPKIVAVVVPTTDFRKIGCRRGEHLYNVAMA